MSFHRFAYITLAMCIMLVIAASSAAATTHSCVHDSIVVPLLLAEDAAFPNGTRPTAVAPYELSPADRAAGRTLAVGSIRFAVRTPDLYDSSKYCTSASGTSSNMQGGSMACSDDTVLTDTKRDILLNQLLPEALRRLSAALSVTQVTGNLIVPRGACSYFTIPTADSTSGVANADFVLYVSAAPAAAGTIAWAGYCSRDAAGRPVVGRTNISPRYIAYTDYYIRVVMHELAHALGFSSALFLSTTQSTQGTIRGKTATFVTSPKVVAAYREFSGCATATGPEVEDEGGSGTAGSHWERRNLRDDLMCGIAGAGRLSKHTLAVFEDSGLYTTNYEATETMAWGSQTGCTFLTEKCSSSAAGVGQYWCDTSGPGCTFDRKAIGACDLATYTSNLPAAFRYFSDPTKGGSSSGLMDYCPTIVAYSNRQCDDATYAATSSDLIFGLTFASSARCFDTTSFIKSGYSTSSYPRNTCLKVRCVDGARLEVAVHNTGWVACPVSGAAGTVTVAGYSGSIQCPAASTFCSDASLSFPTTSPVSSSLIGSPSTTATTTTTTTSTITSTTKTLETTTGSPTSASAESTTTSVGLVTNDSHNASLRSTTTNSSSGGDSMVNNTTTAAVTMANVTNASTTDAPTSSSTASASTTLVVATTTSAPSFPTKAPSSATAARYYILVLRGRQLGTISALPSFGVSLVADLATAFATTSSSVRIEQQTLSSGATSPSDSDLAFIWSGALAEQGPTESGGQGEQVRLTVAFSVTPLVVSGVATPVADVAFLATSGLSVSWLVQVGALHRAAALAAAATTAATTMTTPATSATPVTTTTTAAPTTTLVPAPPTAITTVTNSDVAAGTSLVTTKTSETNKTYSPPSTALSLDENVTQTTQTDLVSSPTEITITDVGGVVGGSDAGVGDGVVGLTTAAASVPGDDLAVVSASLDPVRTGASPTQSSATVGLPAMLSFVLAISVAIAMGGFVV